MSNSSRSQPKSYLYYVAMLAFFGLGIWLILSIGSSLKPSPALLNDSNTVKSAGSSGINSGLPLNDRSPLSVLLLQIIVIIVVARLFAALFRRIGQPPVMGEMVAGITLGPSLLGLIWPQASTFLFPPTSMTTLGVLSQIGVVLFMFIVGMELDLQHLRERASSAIMVSHASIIVPFLLGAALALGLYPSLAPANTTFSQFGLFMGIAMSITAFPVLARILQDRGLTQSALGTTALTCASVDDATAWCILAFVIATAHASGLISSLVTLALTLLFVIVMLLV
ncbi:MAG TPA: cation:proton antiporter, partial [Pyrinomonadaceae bacterium]